MFICIPKESLGEVEDIVLSSKTSAERTQRLQRVFGENASEASAAFEKSLLLKRREKSLDNFLGKFSEIGLAKKKQIRENYLQNKARKDNLVDDEDLLSIAKEIYDKKYDLDLDLDKVAQIAKLGKEAKALKEKAFSTPERSPERLAYGRKIVQKSNIIEDLADPASELGFLSTIGFNAKKDIQRIKDQKGVIDKGTEIARSTIDIATSAVYKSVNASWDIAFAFRQGWKVLTKSPTVWAKTMKEALKPVGKITSKEKQQMVMDEFKAGIVSSDLYEKAIDSGLALGVIEEFFPTALSEKIPILGNLFKSSDISFTIFSQQARMGLFEDMYKRSVKNNGKVAADASAESFAYVVNSITGRGGLGSLENQSGLLNKIFFSARYVSSALDTFTMPFNRELTEEARKEAMKSSIAALGSIGAVVGTASLFTDVEIDIRSSKFLKARIPGTEDRWIDLSAGLGSYLTLAARIVLGLDAEKLLGFDDIDAHKSAVTGKTRDLNTGEFGARTVEDVAYDFFRNKTAPAPSQILQWLRGRDFSGEKPTAVGSVSGVLTPISGENAYEALRDEDFAQALMIIMGELLGAASIDYSKF